MKITLTTNARNTAHGVAMKNTLATYVKTPTFSAPVTIASSHSFMNSMDLSALSSLTKWQSTTSVNSATKSAMFAWKQNPKEGIMLWSWTVSSLNPQKTSLEDPWPPCMITYRLVDSLTQFSRFLLTIYGLHGPMTPFDSYLHLLTNHAYWYDSGLNQLLTDTYWSYCRLLICLLYTYSAHYSCALSALI